MVVGENLRDKYGANVLYDFNYIVKFSVLSVYE